MAMRIKPQQMDIMSGGYQPIDIGRIRQQSTLGNQEYSASNIGGGVSGTQEPRKKPDPYTPPFIPVTPGMPSNTSSGQVPGDINARTAGTDIDELIKRMNQFYTPESTERERFSGLLDQFPERNKPSFARKLVAGGLGLDARNRKQDPIATMETAMYAPYIRDVGAWKEKTQPYYQSAQLENQANINERTLAGNMVNAQVQNERIASQERTAQEKNRISEIRAKAYDAKARGYEIKVEGDRVIATNPTTLARIDLGPSGGMDQYDLEILKGRYKVEAAKAAGEVSRGNTILRESTLVEDEQGNQYKYDPSGNGAYYPVRPDTPAEPTGRVHVVSSPRAGAAARQMTPNEVAQNKQNVLQTLLDREPTNSEFIKNINGKLSLIPPKVGGYLGGTIGGATDAEMNQKWTRYKAILRQVDPEGANQLDREGLARQQGQPKTPSASQQAAPTGAYRVQRDQHNPQSMRRSADGGKTWEYSGDGGRTWNRGK